MALRHRGTALVWMAIMLPFFLSVVGLSIDGGQVFNARRDLQNIADGAARVGAMQVDVDAYRASSGSSLVLDQAKARQAAASYVSGQGPGLMAQITADQQQVVVQVQKQVPTSFLRIAGLDSVNIQAVAPARPRYGIDRPNGG